MNISMDDHSPYDHPFWDRMTTGTCKPKHATVQSSKTCLVYSRKHLFGENSERIILYNRWMSDQVSTFEANRFYHQESSMVGFTMALLWFHHGFTMVSPWLYYGFTCFEYVFFCNVYYGFLWFLNQNLGFSTGQARPSDVRLSTVAGPSEGSQAGVGPRECCNIQRKRSDETHQQGEYDGNMMVICMGK